MKQYKVTLALEEDVIFSARSATVGAHQTLDYVPGAALYGACAAKLYRTLDAEEAFDVFHSGKVRFGNGLPLDPNGAESYPMPFAWHVIKGDEYRNAAYPDLLDGAKIKTPFSEIGLPQDFQLKQLREGYVTTTGRLVKPRTTFRMKTAIDLETGTAAQAQLFGYAALEAGQIFQATLQIDSDISDELPGKICNSLQGFIRLGRSRSAQYGTVSCRVEEHEQNLKQPRLQYSSQLIFWLISDLALRNEYGFPTFEPLAACFGLKGKLNWEKTFLRFRRYSPYNAYRRCYDQERQVIQQGSVICLDLDEEATEDDLIRLRSGLGDYRYNGLGSMLINDDLLIKELPEFTGNAQRNDSCAEKPGNHKLFQWIMAQGTRNDENSQIGKKVDALLDDLRCLYSSARAYVAQQENMDIGPGKTQWGRVMEVCKQNLSPQDLLEKLHGIVRPGKPGEIMSPEDVTDEDWGTLTGLEGERTNFGFWLIKRFQNEISVNPGKIFALLSRQAINLNDKHEPGVVSDKEMNK
ncbi:CRISPR-associated protein Csx10 [Nitrosomonas marina]|uniref:CRISPR-associated protein Csx10 n=1 Tax=Nitrosomonas marina TaxID=917 RepID=A0A1I0GAN0_9PROT|nr:hypothetical protein [Nitrosomonas marina]SET68101.1 CRISPR-associated protein Csx10 [Nitrosomonas marina]